MIKKLFVTWLFIFAMVATFGQDSLKIGFSVGDFSSDRWSQEPQIFRDEAKRLGASVIFEYAYGDAVQQREQVTRLIGSGIRVLVIFPAVADGWTEIIDNAHKAGIIVIAYERILKNANADYYFSFFNEDVGRQQAQYALDHRPAGNYILLEGPVTDVNSLLFLKGQLEILDPHIQKGEINILMQKHLETWNSIDAFNEIQSFLGKNKMKIDAIVAANDELAAGAIMALDMGLGSYDIVITGQDATIGGCRNIAEGKQGMTIYKSIRNLATQAADNCVKLAKGEKITNVNATMSNGTKEIPAVLLKTVVVDKNNMAETVIADGFIKPEQLNLK